MGNVANVCHELLPDESDMVVADGLTSSARHEHERPAMLAALTGMGLSAAAGLNAYIPYLIVALIARFTDVINLSSDYAWIESNWSIGIASVLLFTEVVVDKIPVVDHINDVVATLIRPSVAGLIFAATSAAQGIDQSQWMQQRPWIGITLGVVVSLFVHTGKALTRPGVNVSTMGFGAPVVSTAEDGAAVGLSLVAIFLPLLVIVALILLVWGLWWMARRLRRLRRRLGSHPPATVL